MKKGFTLVETLVAVGILMLAIAGPLTIAHRGIQSALYARDQVTAYYLAQDAIEYIRSLRDANRIGGNDWLTGLTLGRDITVDTANNRVANCSPSCPPLKFDASTGEYNYTSGVDSIFTRIVQITNTTTDNALITVTIQWNSGAFTQSFVAKDNLMNI